MPGHYHSNKFNQPPQPPQFNPGPHPSLRLMNGSSPSNQGSNNRFYNNNMSRNLIQQPVQPTNNSPPLITDTLTACLDVNGTYVCSSYSPRCYIIQKVTPTNLHVTSGLASIGPPNNAGSNSRNPMVPIPPHPNMSQNKYPQHNQPSWNSRFNEDGKTPLVHHKNDPCTNKPPVKQQCSCSISGVEVQQGNLNSNLGKNTIGLVDNSNRDLSDEASSSNENNGSGLENEGNLPSGAGQELPPPSPSSTGLRTATEPPTPVPFESSSTTTATAPIPMTSTISTMRKTVILRGIPENTPVDEITALFDQETNPNAPHCSNCEFAHNDSWYLTFDDEDDATRAHRYIREEIREFKGQPVMARIKSIPTTIQAQGAGVTRVSNGYHQPLPSVTFTINPSAPPFVPIISQSNTSMVGGPPTSNATINQLYHPQNHIMTTAAPPGAVTTIPQPIFAAIATAPQQYAPYTPNTSWVGDPNNYNLNGHGHHGQIHRHQYNSSSRGMGMDMNGRARNTNTRPTNRHMSTTNNYNRRYNPNPPPPPRPLENHHHQNNVPSSSSSSSNHHHPRYHHPSNNNNNNHRQPRNNVKSAPPASSSTSQQQSNNANVPPRNSTNSNSINKFDLVTSESAFPPLVGNGGSSSSDTGTTTTTDVVSNHKIDGSVTVEGRLSADVVKGIKTLSVNKPSNATTPTPSLPMQTNVAITTTGTATTPTYNSTPILHGTNNDENNSQSTSTYVVSAASPPPDDHHRHQPSPCPPSASQTLVTNNKKQYREVGVGSVDDYDYYEESFNNRDDHKKNKPRTLSSGSSSSSCAYKQTSANSKNTADKSTQSNPVGKGISNRNSSGGGNLNVGSGNSSGLNQHKNSNSAITSNKVHPETKTQTTNSSTSSHNKVNRSPSNPNTNASKVMKDSSTSMTTPSIIPTTPEIPDNCSKSNTTTPSASSNSGPDVAVAVSMCKTKLSYADVAKAKSQQ